MSLVKQETNEVAMHLQLYRTLIVIGIFVYFVRMHQFLLTLDKVGILCLVYSNFYADKIILKVRKRSFSNLENYLFNLLTILFIYIK